MQLIRIYILCLITLGSFLSSFAQDELLHYNVSKASKLPSSESYDLIFDIDDNLLIATDKGVVRFDGKNVVLLKDEFNKVSQVYKFFKSNNQIYGISIEGISLVDPISLEIKKSKFQHCFSQLKRYSGRLIIQDVKEFDDSIYFFEGFSRDYFISISKKDSRCSIYHPQLKSISKSNKNLIYHCNSVYTKDLYIKGDSVLIFDKKIELTPSKIGALKVLFDGEDTMALSYGNTFFLTVNDKIIYQKTFDNSVLSLKVVGSKVFIGLLNLGLMIFDVNKVDFYRPISNVSIGNIYVKEKDEIWFSTLEKGVFRLNDFIENQIKIDQVWEVTVLNDEILATTNNQELIRLDLNLNILSVDKGHYKMENFKCYESLEIPYSNKYPSRQVFEKYPEFFMINNGILGKTSDNRTIHNDKFKKQAEEVILRDSLLYRLVLDQISILNLNSGKIDEIFVGDNFVSMEILDSSIYLAGGNVITEYKHGIKNKKLFIPSGEKINEIRFDKLYKHVLWVSTKSNLYALDISEQGHILFSTQGIVDLEIKDFVIVNRFLFLVSKYSLLKLNIEKIESYRIKDPIIDSEIKYIEGVNFPKLITHSNYYYFRDKPIKYLLIKPNKDSLIYDESDDVFLSDFPFEESEYSISVLNPNKKWSSPVNNKVYITRPLWSSWWWYVLLLFLLVIFILTTIFSTSRFIKNAKNKQIERMRLETAALQSQMNPHFTFNSLNSVLYFMIDNDTDKAVDYLSRFSRLLRLTLDRSNISEIPLNDDIEHLKLYLNIEATRFEENFDFNIHIDEHLLESNYLVPPMLVQPIVENSIWHGLLKKKGEKQLELHYSINDDVLEIVIEDNGVGITINEERNDKISHGLKNTKRRIEIFNDRKINRGFQMQENLGAESGVQVVIRLVLKRQNK